MAGDDPRMPTIAGMRRRGYSAAALRQFCDSLAVAKTDGVVDLAQLEFFIRNDHNDNAARAMCVLNPLKVVIENFAEHIDTPVQYLSAAVHPDKPAMGSRELPFTPEIVIDRSDFTEEQGLSRKKFKRLVLGEWVRLRGAYVIKAERVEKDAQGEITTVYASLVANTVGEDPPEGIRPRGVIHWVSASEGKRCTVRLYDRLFTHEAPDRGDEDFMHYVNADSFNQLQNCVVEPSAVMAKPETVFQFEREGYFVADRHDFSAETPVFNLTIGLRATNK